MKAKEFIPASKPRNFVAKNQKTAGAGAHKDKKRAEKQGDVKHKNKQYDEGVAEGSSQKQQKELAYNQGMEDYDDPEVTIPNYKSWGQYAKYYIKGWKSAQELEAGSHRDELERNPERFDDEPSDEQGVAEGLGSYDNDKGIKHTRGSLVAKLEALPKGSEEFEWHKNRAIYHLQQGNMIRAKYYMALMKRGEQGVAEGISVVDQDYDLDQVILTLDIEGKRVSFTYTDYEEDFKNAERRDVFDQLQEQPWYKGLDHPTKMEILDAAYKAIRGEEPSEYKPRVDDEPMERIRDPEDWDEGNTEPPNNFAVYINGKKWKVFQGRGYYADDYREKQHYQQLKDWARKKSEATGKKWEVSITGEPATE